MSLRERIKRLFSKSYTVTGTFFGPLDVNGNYLWGSDTISGKELGLAMAKFIKSRKKQGILKHEKKN